MRVSARRPRSPQRPSVARETFAARRCGVILVDNPGYRLVRVRSTRSKLIGRMAGFFVTKRNTAHNLAIFPKVEILPHERRIVRQCGSGNRGDAQTLREQGEVTDIGATIDGAIHAQVPIRGDDRHMRRTKEPKILERLTGGASSIPTCHTHALVQLPSNFAPPLFISTGILRTREIELRRRRSRLSRCMIEQCPAKSLRPRSFGYHNLPWL